jgi:hypothetical protein
VADGVLNLTAADNYRLNLKVESGLKSRSRDVPVLGETNGMQITRAKVELRDLSGRAFNFSNGLENPYWVSASSYVNPGGFAVVPVTIIGPLYVEQLRAAPDAQIVAGVTIHGKTNGQEEVESDEFSWPIRLIKASPLQIDRVCIPGIPFCLGSLGQDGFAQACKDSASSSN